MKSVENVFQIKFPNKIKEELFKVFLINFNLCFFLLLQPTMNWEPKQKLKKKTCFNIPFIMLQMKHKALFNYHRER